MMDIPERPGQARPLARIPRDDTREWYRIVNHTDAPAEVWIYDEIGYWGTPASDFCKALADLDAEEITVRINSPGGEVWDGLAILNALRDHPATITCKVDGIAASAASFIAQAGDRVVMGRQSQMMIHDASGLCLGNAADMQAMSITLDSLSDVIASVYNDRAGGGVKAWRKAMQAETWYSADEAVAAGLADEVAKLPAREEAAAARAVAQWDLSVFRHAGREAAPAPDVVVPVAVADEPERPAELVGEPTSEELAQPVAAALDVAALRAAFRESLAVATRDAPAPTLPALAAPEPEPDPEPAPAPPPVTLGATELPAAELRERLISAAEDMPAAPRRAFPATPAADTAPVPEPTPEPAYQPLTVAEWLRAAVDNATNTLHAPTTPEPAAVPEPDPAPTIEPAAFRRALKGATK